MRMRIYEFHWGQRYQFANVWELAQKISFTFALRMQAKSKVLLIRFSSIGDIVLTSPIVRCLKKQLPGEVEIHYLTKKTYADIPESNPYISKVFSIERSGREVLANLKNEGYDYIIDLHKNLRSFKIKSSLRAKVFTFNKLNAQKWMLVNFKIDLLPNIHLVDRYFDAVKKLNVHYDGEGLDYFIPEAEEFPRSKLPLTHQKAYVALVVGATHATKRLPFDKLLSLCKKINFPIVLLGGPTDAVIAKDLEDKLDENIFNPVGSLSLHESASLIKNAGCVITYDTGLMHIAAAFNKKIISIWGNTVPEFGMYPFLADNKNGESCIFEINDLKCRPCSKIGFEKCPKGHFLCMKSHDEDAMAAEVFRYMKV